MNTRTILRRTGLIGQVLLPIAICAVSAQLAQGSDGSEHAEILSLSKASDGEYIVFQVAVRRPDDMSTMTIEASPWRTRRTVWPRIALLTGTPRWDYPCYLEYARPERWQPVPRLDRLTFIGRCPSTALLKLTLRYPISEGRLKEVPVELNLGEADALTGEPSPRQRWAAAQAEWFRLLGRHAGDVGGFWTYAAELARPTVSYFLEQQARQVSWQNLVQVWLLGRCGLLEDSALDEVAPSYLGYRLVCPDGGTYRFDTAAGSATSSIHGPLERPLRLEASPPGSPIDRLLEQIDLVTARVQFTEDGLAGQVSISRR